ncbi:MAG TPA: hypothetical protein VMY78_13410 [Solirubrobacteraceae bacterium]|nr:hypothetical protein [Solirubrobacteraceae bacterium]
MSVDYRSLPDEHPITIARLEVGDAIEQAFDWTALDDREALLAALDTIDAARRNLEAAERAETGQSDTPARPHRALGAADTIARLVNDSGVGWHAGAAHEDGPLFATLRATAEDGTTMHITIEELG